MWSMWVMPPDGPDPTGIEQVDSFRPQRSE
jgi:hypothetical protein